MNNHTIYCEETSPESAALLILEKGGSIKTVSLCGNMSIGRDSANSSNDIKLCSRIAGRNHGSFIYYNGDYYYRDNNSLNGTFYNGVKLESYDEKGSRAVKLKDGDVLRIDRIQLNKPHPEAVEMIFGKSFDANGNWVRYYLKDNAPVPIGRSSASGISLSDFMVSRQHARLERFGNGWKIVDNNSKNGISVNKAPVLNEQPLNPFDVIRIANTTMIYLGYAVLFNNASMPQIDRAAGIPEKAHEKIPEKRHIAKPRSVVMNVNIESFKVKKFGSLGKKTLLKNIDLDIESGDFILILGGSGAGKTTFLRALLGDQRADGSILLHGMDLHKNFKQLKYKIGIVPQFSTTRDNDTVYHTIMDAAVSKLSGEYSKAEITERVDSTIQKMMLTSLKNSLIKNLSGGQKKRVEVAIQAIGDQEIFILDEPDSGMDTASRKDLMSNLKSCTDNGGVVTVISHSPDDAADLYTKVIVLAKSQSDEVGHLAYYGDVPHALSFFGVEKLSDIVMEINYEGGKGRADEFIEKFERTRRG